LSDSEEALIYEALQNLDSDTENTSQEIRNNSSLEIEEQLK